jgi:hypothetical protein
MICANAATDGPNEPQSLTRLLRHAIGDNRCPLSQRVQTWQAILDKMDEVARAIEAIGRLDCSHLLIQGPPEAGKTYTASHAIVEMLARRKRVGVSSHSHKQ